VFLDINHNIILIVSLFWYFAFFALIVSYFVCLLPDPPTTTMQRLKGLTTGGFPTFIDAADNFDPSQTIREDNWLFQLQRQSVFGLSKIWGFVCFLVSCRFLILTTDRKTVFMGDDTWTALYPDVFTEQHPFPSLVVKDIHTVDNGVIKHLFPVLEGRWTFFFFFFYFFFFFS
jgi:phosphatidylinositol glycan class O